MSWYARMSLNRLTCNTTRPSSFGEHLIYTLICMTVLHVLCYADVSVPSWGSRIVSQHTIMIRLVLFFF